MVVLFSVFFQELKLFSLESKSKSLNLMEITFLFLTPIKEPKLFSTTLPMPIQEDNYSPLPKIALVLPFLTVISNLILLELTSFNVLLDPISPSVPLTFYPLKVIHKMSF